MIRFKSMSLFSLRGKEIYIDQFKIYHEIIKQLLIKENQYSKNNLINEVFVKNISSESVS